MKKRVILSLVAILCVFTIGVFGYIYLNRKLPYKGELVRLKGTETYHRDDCKFVKKANLEDIIFLDGIEYTLIEDLRPCKTCNPPDNSELAMP